MGEVNCGRFPRRLVEEKEVFQAEEMDGMYHGKKMEMHQVSLT